MVLILPDFLTLNQNFGEIYLLQQAIIVGLQNWILKKEERYSKEDELARYVSETRGHHREWCVKLLIAHFLYLVNVVGQIFFTDCFLGWEFSTYGVSTASFLEQAAEKRVDPMSRVFPRLTKCTFRKFGPSGTIQRHDATVRAFSCLYLDRFSTLTTNFISVCPAHQHNQ